MADWSAHALATLSPESGEEDGAVAGDPWAEAAIAALDAADGDDDEGVGV